MNLLETCKIPNGARDRSLLEMAWSQTHWGGSDEQNSPKLLDWAKLWLLLPKQHRFHSWQLWDPKKIADSLNGPQFGRLGSAEQSKALATCFSIFEKEEEGKQTNPWRNGAPFIPVCNWAIHNKKRIWIRVCAYFCILVLHLVFLFPLLEGIKGPI